MVMKMVPMMSLMMVLALEIVDGGFQHWWFAGGGYRWRGLKVSESVGW